jgi:hypothetical protein
MTYKVSVSSGNNYSVKVEKPTNYRAGIKYKMPQNLSELDDVQLSGEPDKYVLMYDAALGKWVNVNPDDVLTAAATEPISPGIPDVFSNEIELDAGGF